MTSPERDNLHNQVPLTESYEATEQVFEQEGTNTPLDSPAETQPENTSATPEDKLDDHPPRPDDESADIIATSLLRPERSTKLGRAIIEKFHAGGRELKNIIRGRVGDHEISLVGRPQYNEHYFKIWQEFRDAGLPVVPTLRKGEVDGQQSILMTDLKADGSELYGRGLKRTIIPERRHRPASSEVDEIFLQLTEPDNFTAIQDKAHELAAIATKNGLELPFDDPFELLVSPDGSWQLITIDLEFASKPTREDDIREIKWTNTAHTDDFLKQLQNLRDGLIQVATYTREMNE